jgi:hypothetical protein
MSKVATDLYGELALLPLQPQAPVKEGFEWLTDVQRSKNGSEVRLKLRIYPRQSFSYQVPEQAWQKNAGFNVQYGALPKKWAIPVWTEAQYLGAVASGLTTLPCVTDVYDFRDASLALLWQSPTSFQVLEIDTVNSGDIEVTEETNTFTAAWLMPLRVGRVANIFDRGSNGHNVLTEVLFDVDDNNEFSIDAPTQFLGDDIYFNVPDSGESGLKYEITTRMDVTDFELGIVAQRAPWTYNRVIRPFNVLCENPQQVRDFKGWLMRRSGQYKQFWEPSFENDFQKQSTGTVNSTYLVAKDGLLDWTEISSRPHVAFELDDGSWLTRTLTSISSVSTTQAQLNLSSSLGGIAASRIRRVSWLGLKRLNSDRIEMSWIGAGVMRATVPVVEISP